MLDIHRAEFVDVDDLVVEAVPLLPEDHRALAVELDGDRGRQHDRREDDDPDHAEDDVEGALGHRVPVVDRLVENVEHRHRADVGIGARTEAQLVGMRRQADVDRQHPQLLQQRQHPRLGGQRQRHDQHVDARDAREINQLGDVAELGIAGHHRRRCSRIDPGCANDKTGSIAAEDPAFAFKFGRPIDGKRSWSILLRL